MLLNEIEMELDRIRGACCELLKDITRLQTKIQEEIYHSENVELRLIPAKGHRRRPVNQNGANSLERDMEMFERYRSIRVDDSLAPVLYDRMKESGFTLSDMKTLFGGRSHIAAKICFGRERFRDYEADKLAELFHLTEEEQLKFFRLGTIPTGQHPFD